MKSKILILSKFLLIVLVIVISCTKKKNDGIGPGYGTTGNPNPNGQTTTSGTTYTNPATDNSSIKIGESGWTNPTCGTNNSLVLQGINGVISVNLTFPSKILSGTNIYNINPNGGANTCALTILNAPNQPQNIVWYGQSGVVTVQTTSSSINAFFSGVVCTQASFSYPTVTASGTLGCTQ